MKTKITKITGVHPYADKFPMLPETELAELADSISVNGLRLAIVITPGGLILDGRNRWKACELADVEPATIVYDGEDIAEYVIDANITRRNMSTGQRAMATALVLEADGRRENNRWKRGSVGIAKSGNSESDWQHRLAECGIILDYKPELAPLVVNGEIALNDAYEQADWIRNEEKRAREEEDAEQQHSVEIIENLTKADAQNYLALIEDGSLTPRQAWAAHLDDTRKERQHQAELRQGRSDLYSGMAKALSTLAAYGGYDDIEILMAEYDPAELIPTQLSEFFEIDNLRLAERYVTTVIEWRKNAS
jgi:hypothetical protein